jgi:hypothetical protein
MPRLSIVAHSYGTTTAAVALAQEGVRADNFITLASAGLPDSVQSAADLNVDQIFSGNARDKLPGETESGDQWAWVGRVNSRDHHVNPLGTGFGSRGFGVETGGDAGRIVTDHSPLISDDGDQAGYLDKRTESLQNVARVIKGDTGDITAYAPLGLTNFQQSMVDGANNVT